MSYFTADVPYSREVTTIVRDELQRLLDMSDDLTADEVECYVQRRVEELELALGGRPT